MLWLNDLFTFILIGMGFGVFNLLLHWFINQRLAMNGKPALKRKFLTFGGDHPLSIGNKINWSAIYISCYAFALLQSWHLGVGPGRLYVEIALSMPQALFMTFGLFIVDRMEFLFRFLFDAVEGVPKTINPATVQPSLPPAVSPELVPSAAPVKRNNLFKYLWRSKKEQLKAIPSVVSEKIDTVITEHAEARIASKRAEEEKKRQGAQERMNKFRDLTDGH
ncbi:MAG: hypothetical protein Q7S43_05120 [bacterium]|nr:hypothetical protein [bacterium]